MSVSPDLARPDVASLYSQHHRWLHAWLSRKLGCTEQAVDILHDTFLRVLGPRHAAEAANWREPRAYLTTVARRLVTDHWRRRELERAWLEALAHLPEPETPSPETRLLLLEALDRVDRVLNELPPLTREIFLRSQLHGQLYAAIAADLKISLPTVKRHMSRAFLACLSIA